MSNVTYEMSNGLRLSTPRDLELAALCYGSAVSLSTIWSDNNNTAKVLSWNSELEDYLDRRARLIDVDGRENYLPWNAYKNLELDWIDGYAYPQTRGDCCSFGHRNSLKASNLTNAIRTGIKPRDTAQSVVYAIARGDGTPRFGDGLNLNPMASYAAEYGNFWVDDFGKYNGGSYVRKYQDGSEQTQHALETQSIVFRLPEITFDTVYRVCSAGIGINIGAGEYPTSARQNNDGLALAKGWSGGGHSMALIAAWKGRSGERYVYLENSHGAIYEGDTLHKGAQYGCWLNESLFDRIGQYNNMYGDWYGNLGEITRV